MTTNNITPWKETYTAAIWGDSDGNVTGTLENVSGKSLLMDNEQMLNEKSIGQSMLGDALKNLLGNLFAPYPIISETAPDNPTCGQVWLKPIGKMGED